MISTQLRLEVEEWIANDPDPKTSQLLRSWLESENLDELTKSFNGFLEFGTAGLRGPVRPGPSGMNRAVVGRTAAGIAQYLKAHGLSKVVIGRDARHGSSEFLIESAQIFSGAGLEVYVLPRELPTPVLAFAVKELKMDCGVMITASHNPASDNGYKVYLGGSIDGVNYSGSQIISPADRQIFEEISRVQLPSPRGSNWNTVSEELITKYLEITARSSKQAIETKIVYTAMHGVGTKTLLALFDKANFTKPILVTEQAEPDPDFPTVSFPNPEEPGAIDLAIKLAIKESADLVIANDPDADRCAIAAKDGAGDWRMLRGDELGIIFGHYIANSSDVANKVLATSIVSSSALSKISQLCGAQFVETLTGFKWISKIGNLAFGYEEAIGYCVDPNVVNDKDGISAALKIAEISSELIAKGSNIFEYLHQIWAQIGYHRTEQLSIRVENLSTIATILENLKANPPAKLANFEVTSFEDLEQSNLPTVGFRIWAGANVRIIIRPSGTEPKLKSYIEVVGDRDFADKSVKEIALALNSLFTSYS